MSDPDHYTPPPAEERRARRRQALEAFLRDSRRAVESATDHKPSSARRCCLCGNLEQDELHQLRNTPAFICNAPHR